jgi:SAM-dependent methyltransferase
MSTPRLNPGSFRRDDESPDMAFYAQPRFVTHIDDAAIAAVTQLYREFLPSGGAVLDLMSSWVSHLPPDVTYRAVVGLGMNHAELAANPRLTRFVVQDLNRNPVLPFSDGVFDAVVNCVSIDYLIQPLAVLREVARVLRPGGPLVITFSNRCFPTKAIQAWLATDDAGRIAIVRALVNESGSFKSLEVFDRSPSPGKSDPLFGVVARSPAKPGQTG